MAKKRKRLRHLGHIKESHWITAWEKAANKCAHEYHGKQRASCFAGVVNGLKAIKEHEPIVKDHSYKKMSGKKRRR